jgi:hypothetical protein
VRAIAIICAPLDIIGIVCIPLNNVVMGRGQSCTGGLPVVLMATKLVALYTGPSGVQLLPPHCCCGLPCGHCCSSIKAEVRRPLGHHHAWDGEEVIAIAAAGSGGGGRQQLAAQGDGGQQWFSRRSGRTSAVGGNGGGQHRWWQMHLCCCKNVKAAEKMRGQRSFVCFMLPFQNQTE